MQTESKKKRILKAYKKTVSIVNEQAIELYQNLGQDHIGFLMESTDKENGKYTFMGVDPEEIIQSDKNSLVIKDLNGKLIRRIEGNPLEALKNYYDAFEIRKEDSELEFAGGLVGSLGYDFIKYSEKLPDENPDKIGIETIQLMLASRFIAIDHEAETITAIVLDEDSEEGKRRALKKANELIDAARSNKSQGLADDKKDFVKDGKIIEKTDSLEQYSKKVEKIKEYIKEGHIFQTVLSQRWTISTKRSGFELYQELRRLNPSPYLYYYNFGDFEIIGSSPELMADEKERAEHVMLVDLARNDMGRISKIGTVKVTDFMKIQRYSHVMHIVSLVEGRKRENAHSWDILSTFLPAGTLSGAPKIRAMEIIDELEEVKRGLYGGATGYMAFDGNMNFCITIRTMIKKGENVYLQAGAGIVMDSKPELEYKECCNKVMALAKTLVEEENL